MWRVLALCGVASGAVVNIETAGAKAGDDRCVALLLAPLFESVHVSVHPEPLCVDKLMRQRGCYRRTEGWFRALSCHHMSGPLM